MKELLKIVMWGKTVGYFILLRIQSLDKTRCQSCQINGVYAAPSAVTKFVCFLCAYIFMYDLNLHRLYKVF